MAFSLLSSAALRRLEGKVALITGGACGIGETTARLFRRHGAEIVIADIRDEKGRSLSRELGASYVHCDVTDESHVRSAVDYAVSLRGKLDIAFANAGTVESYSPITEHSHAEFGRVLATNMTGTFLTVKHAALAMSPQRRGSIVCTASVGSVMGGITPHGYACSKHAVVGLVRNAAVELGQVGVRVNCVSPHITATELACRAYGMSKKELEEFTEERAVLKGRVLRAEDVADAVLFLASDESNYVSGHNLVVDGAFTQVNPSLAWYKY